ncbi:Chromatin assembly factor 1, subunit A [Balamuthia mandrillaris]
MEGTIEDDPLLISSQEIRDRVEPPEEVAEEEEEEEAEEEEEDKENRLPPRKKHRKTKKEKGETSGPTQPKIVPLEQKGEALPVASPLPADGAASSNAEKKRKRVSLSKEERELLKRQQLEERARKKAEQEAKKQQLQLAKEEKARQREEERRKREEALAKKEEEKRKRLLEREERKKAKEEEKKLKQEERKKAEEQRELERQKKEEEKKKKEEERKKKEEERKKKEEERVRIEEEKKQKMEKQKNILVSFLSSPTKNQTASPAKRTTTKETKLPLFPGVDLPKDTIRAPIRPLVYGPTTFCPSELDDLFSFSSSSSSSTSVISIQTIMNELNERKKARIEATKKQQTQNKEQEDDEELIMFDNERKDRSKEEISVHHQQHKRMKLLQFHENNRPPYFGTWSKQPAQNCLKHGRRPFAKDPSGVLDYDYDSDDDWAEEEPGELIGDEDDEQSDEEDEDEENDGWLVPDGYLSEDEGIQAALDEDGVLDDDKHKELFCDASKEKVVISSSSSSSSSASSTSTSSAAPSKLVPIIVGPFFCSDDKEFDKLSSSSSFNVLRDFKVQLLCSEVPILVAEKEKKATKEKEKDETMKSKETAVSFPEELLPALATFVQSNAEANSILKLVTQFKELHSKVSKRQIKMKIKEIATKEKPLAGAPARWTLTPEILLKLKSENQLEETLPTQQQQQQQSPSPSPTATATSEPTTTPTRRIKPITSFFGLSTNKNRSDCADHNNRKSEEKDKDVDKAVMVETEGRSSSSSSSLSEEDAMDLEQLQTISKTVEMKE